MNLKLTMERLGHLYDKTGIDWELTVHHCLTEPTCPTVIINPEGFHAARYRVDADSIEQGIAEAVERVYREVILGEVVEGATPWTNPDDVRLGELISAWRRGEKPEVE